VIDDQTAGPEQMVTTRTYEERGLNMKVTTSVKAGGIMMGD
jgi:hypothetical protein